MASVRVGRARGWRAAGMVQEESQVELYDISGKLVGRHWTREGRIDVSGYPAGIYILQLRAGRRHDHVKLLINR